LLVVGGAGDRGDQRLEPGQAGWPTDAKSIIAIIDFIILAVNLVNLAIASLYFRP
jgi:hypothetical protein